MKIRTICLCVLICFIAGCQQAVPTAALQDLPATQSPAEADTLVNPDAWNDWKTGPHAAAYDLGKGPNTYCARCHSPQNWDANAKIDLPPNCVSCKFETEESPRIAVGNPLIPENEWKGIGCGACHKVKNGVTSSEIAWFNQQTGYYETVSSNALCEKCHTNTLALKYKVDLGDGVHNGYSCTKCHQPHSVAASCLSEGCHPDVTFLEEQSPVHAGHTAFHQSIDCIACHDASGLKVDKLGDQGVWTTIRTTALLGRETSAAYVSHNLAKAVDCARCHFPDNPWNILDSVLSNE